MLKIKVLAFFLLFVASTGLWNACHYINSGSESDLPAKISYNFHVRPILSDKCFACHGPDKNKIKAGLRLDNSESAYAPLKETKGAFAIVPGKPEASELMRRITSQDADYQMPTPESHLGHLNDREIKILERWIEQGAE